MAHEIWMLVATASRIGRPAVANTTPARGSAWRSSIREAIEAYLLTARDRRDRPDFVGTLKVRVRRDMVLVLP